MDKNRTIVVIISIIIMVMVISAVALWLFYPRNPSITGSTGSTSLQYVQGNEITPQPVPSPVAVLPSATPAPAASQVPSIVNQQVLIVDGSSPDYHIGPDGQLVRNDSKTSANPAPSATAASGLVVSGGATAAPVPATSNPRVTASPPPVKVAPSHSKVTIRHSQATAAPSKLPAAAPAVIPARHEYEFWIQVIASTNKDRVEQIKKELANFGFNGIIKPFSKTGTDYYRLRYGPYFAKGEAEKFRDWVKLIKGLEASYVVPEKSTVAKSTKKK